MLKHLQNICKTFAKCFRAVDFQRLWRWRKMFYFTCNHLLPSTNTICWNICKTFAKHFQRWLHVKQESDAVARKPRDAAAVVFALKFSDNIHYKFKSSQASKARLQSSKHTGAKQFNAKWPFKVIHGHVFWSQWKDDKGLSNTNLFVKVPTMYSVYDLQSFCGSQIFCGSRSASAHLHWSHDINKLYTIVKI